MTKKSDALAGFLAKVETKAVTTKKADAAALLGTDEAARVLIAMDATASRSAAWATARRVMSAMFREVPEGLEAALAYFQGHDTFQVSRWVADAEEFTKAVAGVGCVGGNTQILRVLDHAATLAKASGLNALVLVGDAFEEDPNVATVQARALRALNVPVFAFLEGDDPRTRRVFRTIANESGGALLPFDTTAPDALRELLAGIACYAKGGMKALEAAQKRLPGARLLLTAMKGE